MTFIHSFFVRQPAPYPKVGSLDAHRGGEPQLTSQQRPATLQCRGLGQSETRSGLVAQRTERSKARGTRECSHQGARHRAEQQ